MRYLARWSPRHKLEVDLEVHEEDDRIVRFSHLGGRKLELKREEEEKLYGQIVIARANFKNRMKNVLMLKTEVEIYQRCDY